MLLRPSPTLLRHHLLQWRVHPAVRPPRTLTPTERANAVRSLRTVGGIYDHIANIVQHDTTTPHERKREHPMPYIDDMRRSPWPELCKGDHVTIEKPNGDRLRREVSAGGKTARLGVWLTPAHWANVETLQRDGWILTSHEPTSTPDASRTGDREQ